MTTKDQYSTPPWSYKPLALDIEPSFWHTRPELVEINIHQTLDSNTSDISTTSMNPITYPQPPSSRVWRSGNIADSNHYSWSQTTI